MPPIAVSTEIPQQHHLPAPSTPINSWEDLNQQAKQLENDLDVSLINFTRTHSLQLAASIEGGLAHLASILDAQGSLLNSQGISLPSNAMNTIQRHKEILAEYQREFKRTKILIDTKGSNDKSFLLQSSLESQSLEQTVSEADQVLEYSKY